MMRIPTGGTSRDDILETLHQYRARDMDRAGGKAFGYAYVAGQRASALGKEVHSAFLDLNALDPTLFPSLLRIENDLVAMCAGHANAPDGAVGNFTSGGTESILLAVKAARDAMRVRRPEVTRPELIVASTAHAAFHKAGHYLGVEVVSVPVDPTTLRMRIDETRRAITANTILLVGSAPSYAHGVIDPIEDLGALALERGLLLHVDGCIGAFLLPYFERLGVEVPRFDFRVPGVTSLSMDLHKFAYAPKGASMILYADPELRRHQLYACAKWTGYAAVNTTIQGSKTGAPMAAAWAVLRFLGDDGYLALAERVLAGTSAIVDGIAALDGVEVMGHPDMSLVAFTSTEVNVFHLADELKARGWHVQAQLAYAASVANIHLTITPANAGAASEFLADLAASVDAVRRMGVDPELEMIRGLVGTIDFDTLDGDALMSLLAMANGGGDGTALPARMAHVNEALSRIPARARERLLTEFFHRLFAPSLEPVVLRGEDGGGDVDRQTPRS